jgi:hypothetical protein
MGRSISASIKYDFIPLSADHARLTKANPAIVTADKAASKTKFNGGGGVGPISQLHKR